MITTTEHLSDYACLTMKNNISVTDVLSVVCGLFNVSVGDTIRQNRNQPWSWARHITVLIAYQDIGFSMDEIGKGIQRDRTTIYNALNAGRSLVFTTKRFAEIYRRANIILSQNRKAKVMSESTFNLHDHVDLNEINLLPLYHYIIVKQDPKDDKLGNIFIPATGQQPKRTGTVIAVGDGKFTNEGIIIPLRVKVGDKVFWGEYSGVEFEWNGGDYKWMREDEVIAKVL